jgi:hypothetical protein
MKKCYFIVVLMMLVFAGGCNNYLGNEDVGDYEHQNSTELLNMKSDEHGDNEDRAITTDEITDQNPNFLNLNTHQGTHVNNIGIGVEKAKDVIRANNQFTAGPIWRNGNHLDVTVYPKGDLKGKQKQQARAKLEKELKQSLPSYTIDMRVRNR